MASGQHIFQARNHHRDAPPAEAITTGDEVQQYRGYFENCHGEQAIFVFDYRTERGTLYHGDAEWEPVTVVDGIAPMLILDDDERAWLAACWRAAQFTLPARREHLASASETDGASEP